MEGGSLVEEDDAPAPKAAKANPSAMYRAATKISDQREEVTWDVSEGASNFAERLAAKNVHRAVSHQLNKGGRGTDCIGPEDLKPLPDVALQEIADVCNAMEASWAVPWL